MRALGPCSLSIEVSHPVNCLTNSLNLDSLCYCEKKFAAGWIAMNTMCTLCPPSLSSSLSLWEVPASHCCFLKCGNYACDQLCTCTCVVCKVWCCARAQLPLVDVCTSLSEACALGSCGPGAAVCQILNAPIPRHKREKF